MIVLMFLMLLIVIITILAVYEDDPAKKGSWCATISVVVNVLGKISEDTKVSTKSDKKAPPPLTKGQEPVKNIRRRKLPSKKYAYNRSVTVNCLMQPAIYISRDPAKFYVELLSAQAIGYKLQIATAKEAVHIAEIARRNYIGTTREIKSDSQFIRFCKKVQCLIKKNSSAYLLIYRVGSERPFAYISMLVLNLHQYSKYLIGRLNDGNLSHKNILGDTDLLITSRSSINAPYAILLNELVFPKCNSLEEKKLNGNLAQAAIAYLGTCIILETALFGKDNLTALMLFKCRNLRFNSFFKYHQINNDNKVRRGQEQTIAFRVRASNSHFDMLRPIKAM